jgi:hypothetical protein
VRFGCTPNGVQPLIVTGSVGATIWTGCVPPLMNTGACVSFQKIAWRREAKLGKK